MADKTHYPEIYDRLSAPQRIAVTHGEGSLLVTAGPGSGKTHVLTSRILYLIQERQVPPDRILVITFTREAAGAMRRRYCRMTAGYPVSDCARSGQVTFATFHSFFYQILRSAERYSHYRIIGDSDRQKILYPLLCECRGRQGETSPYFDPVSQEEVRRVLAAISYGKNTGRSREAGEKLPEPWKEHFYEISRRYERLKSQRRQLELDDLLTQAYRELERDGDLLRYWQRRYSHILVDEFQDCNQVQYEIVKKLCSQGGDLFAVGDDDQAIYGFRGADPGIMGRFREEHGAPGGAGGKGAVPHVVLGRNYRCAPEIVKASAAVIACNRQREPKQLVSARDCAGSVRIMGFAGAGEERRYVLAQCAGRTCGELNRWAVLFRTNSLLGIFGAELVRAGIPYVTGEKPGSIYEHFIVRDVTDYFRAAHGSRQRQIFLRIWNRPRLHIGREALYEPQVDLERVRQFYSRAPYQDPAAVRDVEQFERKLEQLRKFPLELGVRFIRRGFGYEEYLRCRAGDNRELLANWLEVLDWLEGDCRDCDSLREWERRQEMAADRTAADRTGHKKDPSQGIHILTMHAAKGLEYDRVFLMDVNEGNIPRLRQGEEPTPAYIEEERRLLYVAMTRARDSLELLYQKGTTERPRLPSTFLQPLLGDSAR